MRANWKHGRYSAKAKLEAKLAGQGRPLLDVLREAVAA